MRVLFSLLCLSLSSALFAQVNIVPPTSYDNGQPLALSDIASYDICISNVDDDICTSTIMVPGNETVVNGIPGDTKSAKARTIDIHGREGDYGPRFYSAFRSPLAPGLTYSITLTVGR